MSVCCLNFPFDRNDFSHDLLLVIVFHGLNIKYLKILKDFKNLIVFWRNLRIEFLWIRSASRSFCTGWNGLRAGSLPAAKSTVSARLDARRASIRCRPRLAALLLRSRATRRYPPGRLQSTGRPRLAAPAFLRYHKRHQLDEHAFASPWRQKVLSHRKIGARTIRRMPTKFSEQNRLVQGRGMGFKRAKFVGFFLSGNFWIFSRIIFRKTWYDIFFRILFSFFWTFLQGPSP